MLDEDLTDQNWVNGHGNANLEIEGDPEALFEIYESALNNSVSYGGFGEEVSKRVLENTDSDNLCNIEHSDMADALEMFYTGEFDESLKMRSYVNRATELFGFDGAEYLGERIYSELEVEGIDGFNGEEGAVIL